VSLGNLPRGIAQWSSGPGTQFTVLATLTTRIEHPKLVPQTRDEARVAAAKLLRKATNPMRARNTQSGFLAFRIGRKVAGMLPATSSTTSLRRLAPSRPARFRAAARYAPPPSAQNRSALRRSASATVVGPVPGKHPVCRQGLGGAGYEVSTCFDLFRTSGIAQPRANRSRFRRPVPVLAEAQLGSRTRAGRSRLRSAPGTMLTFQSP
jgi:hypothetical protein